MSEKLVPYMQTPIISFFFLARSIIVPNPRTRDRIVGLRGDPARFSDFNWPSRKHLAMKIRPWLNITFGEEITLGASTGFLHDM